MKVGRLVSAVAILGTAAISLTACDPPMPPEVAAALAEQTYTCIQGDAKISSDAEMTDLVTGWIDSLTYACVDPEPVMTLTGTDNAKDAQVVISDYTPDCTVSSTIPFAVDAGAFVYTESDLGTLNLSPKSMAGILTGKITNWNQLSADNAGYDMPNRPLVLSPEADALALKSVTDYLATQGITLPESLKVKAVDHLDNSPYAALPEGSMAIVPNSFAVSMGLYPANIYLGVDSDKQDILATPDVSGIQSASTQWDSVTSGNSIKVKLDTSKKPLAPEGSDVAPTPYQMIYPVNLSICGAGELLPRAIARFLLRLDSQGALAASNYAPLPEAVRIQALVSISKGLPTPKPTPTN